MAWAYPGEGRGRGEGAPGAGRHFPAREVGTTWGHSLGNPMQHPSTPTRPCPGQAQLGSASSHFLKEGHPLGMEGTEGDGKTPSTSLYISGVPRTFVRPRFLRQHSTNPTFSPAKVVSENCWPIKNYLLLWFFKITCLSLQEGGYTYKK